jgi:hypothetical protein
MKTSEAFRLTKMRLWNGGFPITKEETKMKTSEAFRLTKEKLYDGVGPCPEGMSWNVCGAAMYAGVYNKVKCIIMDLIKPYLYLGNWLKEKYKIQANHDMRRYQITRHAWVDHLIEHYESLGD